MKTLLLLRLRRDRFRTPVWLLILPLLWWVSARSIGTEFAATPQRDTLLRAVVAAPALLAIRGLPRGDSTPALVFFQLFTFVAVVIALMNVFLAVRHTRADEEAGRDAQLAAGSLSRTSSLLATILYAMAADLLLAVLTAAVLRTLRYPIAGSVLTGLACGAVGLAFLGLGLLAAQLFSTARTAHGVAGGLVGVAFALRAVGDALGTPDLTRLVVTPSWLSHLSPIGWGQQVSPFLAPTLWPLALLLDLFVVSVGAAVLLRARRDIGSSLLTVGQGRSSAPVSLRGPVTLVARLERGAWLGWLTGSAALGAMTGGLATAMQAAVEGQDNIRRLLAQLTPGGSSSITDTFVVAIASMTGLLAAAAGTQTVLRWWGEESAGRVDQLAAGATDRGRLLLGLLGIGTVVVVAVTGTAVLAAVVTFELAGADADRVSMSFLAMIVQVPAAVVLTALAVTAVAVVPRWSVVTSWAVVGLAYVVGPMGAMFDLPSWVRDLSPLQHSPVVPGDQPQWMSLTWLVAVAAALAVVAVLASRRRESVS